MFFQKETSHKLIYCLQSTLCFQICLLSNSMFLFIHIQYFLFTKHETILTKFVDILDQTNELDVDVTNKTRKNPKH